MNQEPLVTKPAQAPQVVPLPQTKPDVVPLDETLAAIRRDAQISPGVYLNDTLVPHGGE